jgi:hypothetical protein
MVKKDMAKKRKTISFSIDEADYQKIRLYAKAKGHGGQYPTSSFAHYAVFQMMKKYPLSNVEIKDIETNIENAHQSIQAVQLDTPRGK